MRAYWFKQVIEGLHGKSLDCELVVGGNKHSGWRVIELAEQFETVGLGHIDIEKQDVGLEGFDQFRSPCCIRGFPDDGASASFVKQSGELDAGQALVVNQKAA